MLNSFIKSLKINSKKPCVCRAFSQYSSVLYTRVFSISSHLINSIVAASAMCDVTSSGMSLIKFITNFVSLARAISQPMPLATGRR